jgi:phage terminase small subunit
MALTGKKRAFADVVLAGLSNKDAAIAAGYSSATAAQAGSRLVKDPDIAQYLAEQKKACRKKPVDKSASAAPAAPQRPPFDLAALVNFSDPKAFLKAVMNEPKVDLKQRVEAAKALMPFEHQKKGEGGKKEAQADAAKQAGNKFGTPRAPGLKRVK